MFRAGVDGFEATCPASEPEAREALREARKAAVADALSRLADLLDVVSPRLCEVVAALREARRLT